MSNETPVKYPVYPPHTPQNPTDVGPEVPVECGKYHGKFKLGLKAVKRDSRTLKLKSYLHAGALAAPPDKVDWSKGISDFGMMLNDSLSDCTIAAVGHSVQIWSANQGEEVTEPDGTVKQYYEKWDGYNPSDPSTDQGGIELDVLTSWRKEGFDGHQLLAFAEVDTQNLTEVEQAINLFGVLYIGFQVPSYLDETPGAVWDVQKHGRIEGGHAVVIVGYDARYFYVLSWGKIYKMTPAFFEKYVSEAYALLGGDWVKNNVDPAGIDLTTLQSDLAAITK
jgi:hypothetical protein